jgi:CHAT domain-containing protein/tetratricopeptide (TPR) repeat protein
VKRCKLLAILVALVGAIATPVLIWTLRAEEALEPGNPPDPERTARLEARNQFVEKAKALAAEGSFDGAIEAANRALVIQREIFGEMSEPVAAYLEQLAEWRLHQHQFDEAKSAYEQIVEIRRGLLGDRHWRVTDARLALADAEFRARISDDDRRELAEAESLGAQVAALYGEGDYASAVALSERESEIRKRVQGEKHSDHATTLSNRAVLYQLMGDPGRAEPLYQQALEISKATLGENHPDVAVSLNNLATLYRSMGNYSGAEPMYRQALKISRDGLGEDDPSYAMRLDNLAGLYKSMGDYARSEPMYHEALKIRKAALGEFHPQYAMTLNNLAHLYWSMRDYARAEPYYREALEILKNSVGEQNREYAATLNNLAALYEDLRDYARAAPLYEKAMNIWKDELGENHPDYATSLNNLGSLYDSMGEFTRAEPLYRRAMEIRRDTLGDDHPDYASSVNNLAGLYEAIGEVSKAAPLYRRAAAVALTALETALSVGSEDQQARYVAENRFHLDRWISNLVETGDRKMAQTYGEVFRWKGVVGMNQVEQARAGTDPQVADLLVNLRHARQQLATLAFAVPTTGEISQWRQQVETLRRRKDELESDLARLSAAFRDELQLRRLAYGDLVEELPENACFVDLMEYTHTRPDPDRKGKLVFESRLIAFVVRAGKQPVLIQLGPASPIYEALSAWRRAVVDLQDVRQPGDRLRQLVWTPIEAELVGATHILVSPDGALCQLPFGALPAARDGAYLLEDFALTYAASAQELVQSMRRDQSTEAPGGLLAVGNVDYQQGRDDSDSNAAPETSLAHSEQAARQLRAGFAPLPGTALEVEQVAALFQQVTTEGHVTLLTQGGAGEAPVTGELQAGWSVVHLATHGFFESPERLRNMLRSQQEPVRSALSIPMTHGSSDISALAPLLRSGLAFAGAARDVHQLSTEETLAGKLPDDGILTAEEVASLDMRRTELVTLSACDTGLGELRAGQGVLGLGRAFHRAGVGTVISSLWRVDDAVTMILMEEFYTNLWTKKLPKHEALRQAQIAVLNGPQRLVAEQQRLDAQLADRGLTGRTKPLSIGGATAVTGAKPPHRTHPAFWAAFVLSGSPE